MTGEKKRRIRVTLTEEGFNCLQRAWAAKNHKPPKLRKCRNGKIDTVMEFSEERYQTLLQLRDARRAHGDPKATVSDLVDEAMKMAWNVLCTWRSQTGLWRASRASSAGSASKPEHPCRATRLFHFSVDSSRFRGALVLLWAWRFEYRHEYPYEHEQDEH